MPRSPQKGLVLSIPLFSYAILKRGKMQTNWAGKSAGFRKLAEYLLVSGILKRGNAETSSA